MHPAEVAGVEQPAQGQHVVVPAAVLEHRQPRRRRRGATSRSASAAVTASGLSTTTNAPRASAARACGTCGRSATRARPRRAAARSRSSTDATTQPADGPRRTAWPAPGSRVTTASRHQARRWPRQRGMEDPAGQPVADQADAELGPRHEPSGPAPYQVLARLLFRGCRRAWNGVVSGGRAQPMARTPGDGRLRWKRVDDRADHLGGRLFAFASWSGRCCGGSAGSGPARDAGARTSPTAAGQPSSAPRGVCRAVAAPPRPALVTAARRRFDRAGRPRRRPTQTATRPPPSPAPEGPITPR